MEDRLQDYVLYAGPIGHGRKSEVHKARKMVSFGPWCVQLHLAGGVAPAS